MKNIKKVRDYTRLREWSIHLLVLAIWELACRTVIPAIYLPAPTAVFQAFVATIKSGELGTQLGQTASVLFLGFFITMVTGMLVGIAMGASRTFGHLLDPYINALISGVH